MTEEQFLGKMEALNLEEIILEHLLEEARRCDSKRFFAGIRKPSKTTRMAMDMLSDVYSKRKKVYEEE